MVTTTGTVIQNGCCYTATKVIKNGAEILLGGGGGISKEIFGDGSDGDCVITCNSATKGNYFMEAKTYNFNNLTICSGVKLRFCGNGIPILRVKNCFENNGTICLRNPLLQCDVQYSEPYLKTILCACKNWGYSSALSIANNLTLENLCCSQAYGGSGYSHTDSYGFMDIRAGGGGPGGSMNKNACSGCTRECVAGGAGGTSTTNAAGGGGGGGVWDYSGNNVRCYQGTPGCNANGNYGGAGGNGGNSSNSYYYGGGGGGGFGLDGGGAGGANCGYGYAGNGGNSINGTGGKGGNATWYAVPGQGGCSYRGNGGAGGDSCCCYSGNGGCSVYGNGGAPGSNPCSKRGNYGNSLYGDYGGTAMNGQSAWGGIYDIGIFAKSLKNNGVIQGCGKCCGGSGTRGSNINLAYHEYTSIGSITCAGNGCPNGSLCTYII